MATLLVSIILITGPAAATHPIYKSSSDSDSCASPTLCYTYAYHRVTSGPEKCIGAFGSFVACTVTHYCYARFEGINVQGSMDCNGFIRTCTTALGTCTLTFTHTVTIPNGSCHTFRMSASAIGVGMTATARPNDLTVCVDGYGPY